MARTPRFQPEVDVLIREDYEDGATCQQLAHLYGTYPATIRLAILRAGGTMRRVGARKKGSLRWVDRRADRIGILA